VQANLPEKGLVTGRRLHKEVAKLYNNLKAVLGCYKSYRISTVAMVQTCWL